jgi:hypothetical protein
MAVVPFISQTIVLPLTLEAHAPFYLSINHTAHTFASAW